MLSFLLLQEQMLLYFSYKCYFCCYFKSKFMLFIFTTNATFFLFQEQILPSIVLQEQISSSKINATFLFYYKCYFFPTPRTNVTFIYYKYFYLKNKPNFSFYLKNKSSFCCYSQIKCFLCYYLNVLFL